jgi:hypothetical protein
MNKHNTENSYDMFTEPITTAFIPFTFHISFDEINDAQAFMSLMISTRHSHATDLQRQMASDIRHMMEKEIHKNE